MGNLTLSNLAYHNFLATKKCKFLLALISHFFSYTLPIVKVKLVLVGITSGT